MNFRKVSMSLPTPDRTLLAKPPLVVTLAQVRYDRREAVAGAQVATALVERAAALRLVSMTQIHQQQVIVMSGGPEQGVPPSTAPPQPAGWQFKNADGSTTLTVLGDQMTLETQEYRGWEPFFNLWSACLDVLADVASPSLTTRLGLRYVNRITPNDVQGAADFRSAGLVDPSFLGPSVDSPLSEYVTAAEGRATLTFPEGTDALVHHGVVSEAGSMVFVLDIDCFRPQAAPFDREQILEAFRALNDKSLQVFQTVVRPPLRAEMERVEVAS